MQLVEILLPVTDSASVRREVEALSELFTDKFGGLTAFVRSPGEGVWDDAGAVHHDEVIVLEVMTEELDRTGGASCGLDCRTAWSKRRS